MKRYQVMVPLHVRLVIEVTADSEDAATERAYARAEQEIYNDAGGGVSAEYPGQITLSPDPVSDMANLGVYAEAQQIPGGEE